MHQINSGYFLHDGFLYLYLYFCFLVFMIFERKIFILMRWRTSKFYPSPVSHDASPDISIFIFSHAIFQMSKWLTICFWLDLQKKFYHSINANTEYHTWYIFSMLTILASKWNIEIRIALITNYIFELFSTWMRMNTIIEL